VDAGDVAATAVASQQNDPAGQRRLENAQDVVTVQPKFLSPDTLGSDLSLLPVRSRFVRAGTATNSHPLSADQRIAVAHQFQGRPAGVTAIEQPAQIPQGGAERRPCLCTKEAIVLGACSPVDLSATQL